MQIIDVHEGRITPHNAIAAIGEKLFVKPHATDRKSIQVAEADDLTIGVTVGNTRAGDIAEVVRDMEAVVKAGAAVTTGQRVKSDAQGRAIPAGANDQAAAKALSPATAADEEIVVQLI